LIVWPHVTPNLMVDSLFTRGMEGITPYQHLGGRKKDGKVRKGRGESLRGCNLVRPNGRMWGRGREGGKKEGSTLAQSNTRKGNTKQ